MVGGTIIDHVTAGQHNTSQHTLHASFTFWSDIWSCWAMAIRASDVLPWLDMALVMIRASGLVIG